MFLFACSREHIFKVISGESIDLPKELAYFCRMASRTVSTRSSSLTTTRVAEAPGRLTHIFLCIISISWFGDKDWTGLKTGRKDVGPGKRVCSENLILVGGEDGRVDEVRESSSSWIAMCFSLEDSDAQINSGEAGNAGSAGEEACAGAVPSSAGRLI